MVGKIKMSNIIVHFFYAGLVLHNYLCNKTKKIIETMDKELSIGKIIEKEIRRQGLPITKFAERINCKRGNLYDIFDRNNMDILLLKRISKELNRNFFEDISKDLEIVTPPQDSDAEIKRRESISQFLEVMPTILKQLQKSPVIIFDQEDEENPITPDFTLPDYMITFTIGNTLKERMGDNKILAFDYYKKDDNIEVEVCTNILNNTANINIKLDNKTEKEWRDTIEFAFLIYDKLNIRNRWKALYL